jgi:hypothetical protein
MAADDAQGRAGDLEGGRNLQRGRLAREGRAQRPARIGGAGRAAAVRQSHRLPHRPARAVNHHDHGSARPVARYDRAGAEEPAGAWFHRLAAALRADRQRGRGPQVQQTSNAYRLSLPEKARQFLGRFGKAPPLPDDHSAAQEARAAEVDAYKKALPLDELALLEAGDTRSAGRSCPWEDVQKRESDNQTESPSDLYLRGQT